MFLANHAPRSNQTVHVTEFPRDVRAKHFRVIGTVSVLISSVVDKEMHVCVVVVPDVILLLSGKSVLLELPSCPFFSSSSSIEHAALTTACLRNICTWACTLRFVHGALHTSGCEFSHNQTASLDTHGIGKDQWHHTSQIQSPHHAFGPNHGCPILS